jgi:hypothetical protein
VEHLTTLWSFSQFLPGVFGPGVCTGSLVVVGSLDRLEVRLLSWRPSLLVGSVGFGLWGLDDACDDVLVICLWALATGDIVGVGVIDVLRFSC